MTFQLEDVFELFQGVESDSNGEIGEPEFVGDFNANYTNGDWSVFYGLSVIGGISNEADLRFQRGGDICLPSALRGGDICPVFKVKPQLYHSLSVTRDIGKRFSLTLGVSNLFDNRPPRGSALNSPIGGVTGQALTSGTQYDLVGRRGFISVRAKM
jgi:iron complex outermembrane receptor protein